MSGTIGTSRAVSRWLQSSGTREVPPPSAILPTITRHRKYTLAHEIERHIAFVHEMEDGNDRLVALPSIFVEHYLAYGILCCRVLGQL